MKTRFCSCLNVTPMNTENENTLSIFAPGAPFDAEKDVPFMVPYHIDLDDNGGATDMKTFYEAGVWAYQELKAWRDIIGQETSDKPFIQKIIDAQLKTPRSIYSAAESVLSGRMSATEGFTIIRKDLNAYLTYKSIHSRGTLGKMAAIMYRYEPMLMGILAGASGSADLSDARNFSTSADAESFTFGYAFTLQFRVNVQPEMLDGRVSETLRKINAIIRRVEHADKILKPLETEQFNLQQAIEESAKQLQAYRTDVEQCLTRLVNETRQTSDAAVNEMWNQLNLIQADHERQLASLRQSVASRIRYGTALDYWNSQFAINQGKTNQMTAWYVISSLFFVLVVILNTFIYMKTNSAVIAGSAFGLAALLAGGLIYMLLQTRTRYEKAAAQAQEKVSMLETLAALETEGKTKDADRETVLENVFKTSFTPPSQAVSAPSAEEEK